MLQSAGKCHNKTLFKIKHSSVQYLVNLTDGILSFFILLIEYFLQKDKEDVLLELQQGKDQQLDKVSVDNSSAMLRIRNKCEKVQNKLKNQN